MTIYVSHSGGLDSTAALLEAVHRHGADQVVAVGADYGQRHKIELEHADRVCDLLGVERRIINLQGLLVHGGALVEGEPVPHGHYAAESMASTVVNGRNMLFVAALVGLTQPGDQIWLGVHGGDHHVYPDCRPTFTEPLAQAIRNAYDVELVCPFVRSDKTAIAASFRDRPDVAAATWSCYEGGDQHCGRCGTCVERAEAFHLAGLDDPTVYADPEYWRTVNA